MVNQDGHADTHHSVDRGRGRRRRTRLLWLSLVCVVVGGWFYLNRPVETRIDWGDDVEAALAAARGLQVPVVAHFTASYCPFCWAMERHVLPDDRIEGELDGFVAVRIDSSARPETAERFGVEVIPTFLILAGDGRVVHQATGYQSVAAFTRFLRHGREAVSSNAP